MEFSNKFKSISPSPTLAIDAKFKQMKAEGMNVLPYEMVDVEVDKKTIVSVVNTKFSKIELRWE